MRTITHSDEVARVKTHTTIQVNTVHVNALHLASVSLIYERVRWGYPRASILSCVLASKSLASWRSRNCSSGGPLARLTIRPRLTAGRSPISFVQRVKFLYSCVCRNLRGSL